MRWLFVYGTLMPGRLRWRLVADDVVEQRPAEAPGTLYDTGQGYPAFVPGDGGPVEGWLLGFDDVEAEAMLDRLDEIEGPDYRRAPVTATDGTAAVTYAFVGNSAGFVVLDGRWAAEPEEER